MAEAEKKRKYKVTVTHVEKTPEERARHNEHMSNLLYDMKIKSLERQKEMKAQGINEA